MSGETNPPHPNECKSIASHSYMVRYSCEVLRHVMVLLF